MRIRESQISSHAMYRHTYRSDPVPAKARLCPDLPFSVSMLQLNLSVAHCAKQSWKSKLRHASKKLYMPRQLLHRVVINMSMYSVYKETDFVRCYCGREERGIRDIMLMRFGGE